MFTGLIQEVGQVVSLQKQGPELRFEVDLKTLATKNLEIGESISINGACHTLEKLNNTIGTFFSSEETLAKTNIGFLKTGDYVNLELSLTPTTRMGGHFVSGHIDGFAKLLSVQAVKEAFVITLEISSEFTKYVVNKGSVALNGISLTVSDFKKDTNVFSVAVIPHTWEKTNLQYLRAGQLLNLEVDVLAKYVESITLSSK